MNVIATTCQVILVADPMFPESPLPDSATTAGALSIRDALLGAALLKPVLREPTLDLAPSSRIATVARWQRPYTMKMVPKKNDGDGLEGELLRDGTHHGSEELARVRILEELPALMSDHGEKEGAPGVKPSATIGHW
jgi:hypothetical protein